MPKPKTKAFSGPEPKSHPSYNDMVIDAINELKQPTGSSLEDISKYLPEKYSLPGRYEVQVKKALGRQIKKEAIIQIQNCFKIKEDTVKSVRKPKPPGVSEDVTEATVTAYTLRGRGTDENRKNKDVEKDKLPGKTGLKKGKSRAKVKPKKVKYNRTVSVEVKRLVRPRGKTGEIDHGATLSNSKDESSGSD